MPKVTKHRLLICLLSLITMTKTSWPQDKPSIPDLIKKLKSQYILDRRNPAWALGNIGPEAKAAVPALIKALKDENKGVRYYTGYIPTKVRNVSWEFR